MGEQPKAAHVDVGTETIRTPRTLTGGWGIAIAVAQLMLVPVLFFVGFAFLFVGMGLSPDSTGNASTVRDVVLLVLYAVVFLTVLLLLIGAPTLLIARRSSRARLRRRAAYVPLGFVAGSVLILIGLGIAGFVFGQFAGI